MIVCGFIERAADCDAAAVATSTRKANPVRVRWRLASIAPGLKRAAGKGDDIACVENSLRHPPFRDGQLAGRTLLARRPRWPGRSHRPALALLAAFASDFRH